MSKSKPRMYTTLDTCILCHYFDRKIYKCRKNPKIKLPDPYNYGCTDFCHQWPDMQERKRGEVEQ